MAIFHLKKVYIVEAKDLMEALVEAKKMETPEEFELDRVVQ